MSDFARRDKMIPSHIQQMLREALAAMQMMDAVTCGYHQSGVGPADAGSRIVALGALRGAQAVIQKYLEQEGER